MALVAAVACAGDRPAAPPPEMDRDVRLDGWQRVESRHASLAGVGPRTEQLASQLEMFVAVLSGVGRVQGVVSRSSVQVYLLPDLPAYLHFGPVNTAGYFEQTSRGTFMLVSPDVLGARQVLFHEFVHMVMHNQDVLGYPIWYEEGLAEFLGAMTFREHLVSLGGVATQRAPALKGAGLLPLERILSLRTYSDAGQSLSQFYSQSWLLTHLFHLGHHAGYPKRIEQLGTYLGALQKDADWRTAFDAAFPGGLEAVGSDLDSYRERLVEGSFLPSIRIDTRKLPAIDTRVEMQPIAPADISVELASIHLDNGKGRSRYAQRLFELALERDPQSAPARAGLARAMALQGNFDAARSELARAEVIAPDTEPVVLARGAVMLLEADHLRETDPGRSDAARRAGREALRRARSLAPEATEADVLLGRSYLEVDGDVAEGIEAFGRAHARMPRNDEINLDLARLYVQADDDARALDLLGRILQSWHGGDTVERALALREEIEAKRRVAPGRERASAGGS
jgi:tetratricopeptide (TPR) repeat protein